MGKFLDRTGLKYGRLTVVKHREKEHRNKRLREWLDKTNEAVIGVRIKQIKRKD